MIAILPEHRNLLIQQEGYRQFPYRCTANKLTIGIGRNLESRGIYLNEALMMMDNDIDQIIARLQKEFIWFKKLDAARQGVLINMAFNLGVDGLLKFKKMLSAVAEQNYAQAADEMVNSLWATQVKNRAFKLAEIMRLGKL